MWRVAVYLVNVPVEGLLLGLQVTGGAIHGGKQKRKGVTLEIGRQIELAEVLAKRKSRVKSHATTHSTAGVFILIHRLHHLVRYFHH